jgi:hypothetical protein
VYDAFQSACLITFLIAVLLVLAAHARRPQLLPSWLVVALAAGMGWITSNANLYLPGKVPQEAREAAPNSKITLGRARASRWR